MVFDFYKKTFFSNFYDMSASPFVFKVPFAFCGCDLTNEERTVVCDYSEKAFVLCKAAAMGDDISYREISKLSVAEGPMQAKVMGRQIKGWNQETWDSIECSVLRL